MSFASATLRWLGDQEVNRAIDSILKISIASVGGWWFWHRAVHLPRLNLEQTATVIEKTQERGESFFIVKVLLSLKNVGEVPFTVKKLSVGAVQTLPLPSRVEQVLRDSKCVIDETVLDGPDLAWTGLASEVVTNRAWRIVVRPDEVETIPITLLLDSPGLTHVTILSQLWQGRTLRSFWRPPSTWRIHSFVNLQGAQSEVTMKEEIFSPKRGKRVSAARPKEKAGTTIKIKPPTGGKRISA